MLADRESASMPGNAEQTDCFKGLWRDYSGVSFGSPLDGVFDEVKRSRKSCPGFFQHEYGFTPAQHLDRQEQRRREQVNWKIARLGFFAGVLGAFLGSFLRDLPHWIVSLWRWFKMP
jgi:hypothetical protein